MFAGTFLLLAKELFSFHSDKCLLFASPLACSTQTKTDTETKTRTMLTPAMTVKWRNIEMRQIAMTTLVIGWLGVGYLLLGIWHFPLAKVLIALAAMNVQLLEVLVLLEEWDRRWVRSFSPYEMDCGIAYNRHNIKGKTLTVIAVATSPPLLTTWKLQLFSALCCWWVHVRRQFVDSTRLHCWQ